MSTLREQVLSKEVMQLRNQLALMQQANLVTLCSIVYLCGGELTLTKADHDASKGLLLTAQVDQLTQSITYRTRHVGRDGGDEAGDLARGGLLPPDAGGLPSNDNGGIVA